MSSLIAAQHFRAILKIIHGPRASNLFLINEKQIQNQGYMDTYHSFNTG